MNNELILQSKNDIPFPEARINIHQPTISEISLIGEESFRMGCQSLTISKNDLSDKDKINLENQTDFEIFMSIMREAKKTTVYTNALLVLTLLFPEYTIQFKTDKILLKKPDKKDESFINEANFSIFRDIINNMFRLNKTFEKSQYNPADKLAAKIAAKLQKGKEKINKLKTGDIKKVAVYSRYVSILAVGEEKDKNDLMQYTVSQLEDEFERFRLKDQFENYVKMKLAGAKDLQEVEDWMKDLYS